jgi:hypothetical protein
MMAEIPSWRTNFLACRAVRQTSDPRVAVSNQFWISRLPVPSSASCKRVEGWPSVWGGLSFAGELSPDLHVL